MPLPLKNSAVALAVLASLALPGCRDPEPIRLGFYGELTGRAGGLGTSGRNGFLLAVEQANAAGGVNGRHIDTVICDNRMDAQTAVAALRELLNRQVVAVIGPMTSQMAVTVVPEMDRAHVPMISPTASTDQLSEQDDYFLRVYYSNSQAAQLLASYLAGPRQHPRMVAIYDLGNRAYTEDWISGFRTHYAKLGGQLLGAIPYNVKAGVQFGKLVEQALAAKPDGILLLANAMDTALIAQQIAKRGIDVPLFATGWSYTDDLLQFGGKSVEGLTIIQSADPDAAHPEHLAFSKAYRDRFREAPNFPAIHAYDATLAVLAALRDAGPDGKALKQALLALPPLAGAQKSIAFDRFGDQRNPELHLATIRGGVYRTLH